MDEKAYVEEQIDVVDRNFKSRGVYWNDNRFKVIRGFCGNAKSVLSIGSGGYEPVLIGATHALDIAPNAEKFLQEMKWPGKFILGDCRKLPFEDKSFEVGVLSEVIEHLPREIDVTDAINELDRVCKRWIITTPCNPRGPLNSEKTHRRDFNLVQINDMIGDMGIGVTKDSVYWYIMRYGRN